MSLWEPEARWKGMALLGLGWVETLTPESDIRSAGQEILPTAKC